MERLQLAVLNFHGAAIVVDVTAMQGRSRLHTEVIENLKTCQPGELDALSGADIRTAGR